MSAAPIPTAPPAQPKVLGPNQLAWLRDKVGPFATCERLVLQADEHRQAMLAKVKAS